MVNTIHQRYLSGDLNAKQVENWAWAIEDREDVSVGDEDGDNKNIFFALAELANPATEGELTPRGAKEIIAALQAG